MHISMMNKCYVLQENPVVASRMTFRTTFSKHAHHGAGVEMSMGGANHY
jgi:hypothetical protein